MYRNYFAVPSPQYNKMYMVGHSFNGENPKSISRGNFWEQLFQSHFDRVYNPLFSIAWIPYQMLVDTIRNLWAVVAAVSIDLFRQRKAASSTR
jgi:hypothetical protein